MFVIGEKGKPEFSVKTSEQSRQPTNSTESGIEVETHWWRAKAFMVSPRLLLYSFGNCVILIFSDEGSSCMAADLRIQLKRINDPTQKW